MTDPAFSVMADTLNRDSRQQILWVVDENIGSFELGQIAARPQLRAMTNRIDLHQQLSQRGFVAELSDFSFAEMQPHSVDVVYFRISKEKAIVHHVINRTAEFLKYGGELVLAGCKNEGIKTYIDKATAYLNGAVKTRRGHSTAMLSQITNGACSGLPLDDKDYLNLCIVSDNYGGIETPFYSKPGVYGWNKIDKGSEFLVAQLPELLAGLPWRPATVLDLGCGYGYLCVKASKLLDAHFIATDNNVAAVDLCRKNFENHQVNGEVILADCGMGIPPGVELVLCNPPFHQGFSVDSDLTRRFLHAARRSLVSSGIAVLVVNSFIPLEKKAREYFSKIQCLANNGSFKVLLLSP